MNKNKEEATQLTGRGGADRNQGRKKKYTSETVVMRVPVKAVKQIEKIIKKHEA
jgi:hypothetical protein